ncbi:hypothetical protein GCM10023160_06820 [Brachybacterium paraconglomeratum]
MKGRWGEDMPRSGAGCRVPRAGGAGEPSRRAIRTQGASRALREPLPTIVR